jgi:hypothetical protein
VKRERLFAAARKVADAVPELTDAVPLVLYFASPAEAKDFAGIMQTLASSAVLADMKDLH